MHHAPCELKVAMPLAAVSMRSPEKMVAVLETALPFTMTVPWAWIRPCAGMAFIATGKNNRSIQQVARVSCG